MLFSCHCWIFDRISGELISRLGGEWLFSCTYDEKIGKEVEDKKASRSNLYNW